MRTGLGILLAVAAMLTGGCGLGRSKISAVNDEQIEFYRQLTEQLKESKPVLVFGLERQAAVDRRMQLELLDWELGQTKADVLLKSGNQANEKTRLLLMKLAEIDRGARERREAAIRLHDQRIKNVTDLYDKMIEASAALEKNGKVLVEFLGSSDSEVALRSLDTATIARLAVDLEYLSQKAREQEAATEEERKERREKLDKQLAQAKEVLIDALAD